MVGYIKKIDKIKFGLMSPEDIRRMSVVTVEYPDTYGDDGFPIEKGLMDPRLGIIDPSLVCRTCGLMGGDCQGHFGSIELARPVIHVGFGDVIHKILRSTCNECGRVLLNDEQIEHYSEKIHEAMKNKESINNILKEVYKDAKRELKNMPEDEDEEIDLKYCCPHCGTPQEAIILDKPVTIRQGDYKLTPFEVRERLEKISDDDAYILGINPKVARPEWLVLTVLPVPPVTMRPSITLDTGERSEDDLTHKLTDILRINQRLLENMEAGAPQLIVEDLWELLQYHVTTYFDNDAAGVPPSRHRSGRILKTLAQRLSGKEGRFRSNLSGKRVNFSARTVISPDPNISINEVGVPEMIAKEVTVPVHVNEWNIDEIRGYIENGSDIHPGANYIIYPEETVKRRISDESKKFILEKLQPGDIVERHLKDGDIVLLNRQPSLHRMSIMAHEVRVLPYKTFRINPCVCAPYNADFDGDEMNMHVLQTDESRAEAKSLMRVQEHMLSPRFGGPIIGAIHDHITGAFLLTREGSVFSEEEALQIIRKSHLKIPRLEDNQWILKYDSNFGNDSFIYKQKGDKWTGKELFSLLLPNDLNLSYSAEIAKGKKPINIEIMDGKTGEIIDVKKGYEGLIYPTDGYVVIKNGILEQGVIDESAFGSFCGKILDKIIKEYGPERAKEFLDKSTALAICGIMKTGITTSLNDEEIPEEAIDSINNLLSRKMEEADFFIQSYEEGYLMPMPGRNLEETLEMNIMRVLTEARDMAGRIVENYISDVSDNSLFTTLGNNSAVMAKTGARSSILNLTQITACVGQQSIRGRRIERGYLNRTLPHFKKGEFSIKSKGFIHSSYKTGLDPIEFFFHAMGGRDSLVDKAIRLAQSGYMQRRLVNALQDLKVNESGVVTDNQDNVIQTMFGEDGVDPAKSDFGKPADLNKLIKEIRTNNTDSNSLKNKKPSKYYSYNKSLNKDELDKLRIKSKNLLSKFEFIRKDYQIFLRKLNFELDELDEYFVSFGLNQIQVDIVKKINDIIGFENEIYNLDNYAKLSISYNNLQDYLKNTKREYEYILSEINNLKTEMINEKAEIFVQLMEDAREIIEENVSRYSRLSEKLKNLIHNTKEFSRYVDTSSLLKQLEIIKENIEKEKNSFKTFNDDLRKYDDVPFNDIKTIDNDINSLNKLIDNIKSYELTDFASMINEQELIYNKLSELNNNFKSRNVDVLIGEFDKLFKNRMFIKFELRRYGFDEKDINNIRQEITDDILSLDIVGDDINYKTVIKDYCDLYNMNKNKTDDEIDIEKLLSEVNVENIHPSFVDFCKNDVKVAFEENSIPSNQIVPKYKKCIYKKRKEASQLIQLEEIKENPDIPSVKVHLTDVETNTIFEKVEKKIRSKFGFKGDVLEFTTSLMNKKLKENQSEARQIFKSLMRNISGLSNVSQIKFNKQIEFLINENKIKYYEINEEFINELVIMFNNTGKITL